MGLMGQTVDDIIQYLEQLAPIKTALEWDNVGLLIGERDKPAQRILVALDCTDEVAEEAGQLDVDLIITHHPPLIRPVMSITSDTALGRRLIKLIRLHISLFSAHTNLDMAEGGVNDAMFEILGLTEKQTLMPPGSDEAGLGRIGVLNTPMRLDDLASFVGQTIGLTHTRYAGNPDTRIYKAGLLCGSGSGLKYLREAAANGCQAYITGDLKYHDAQDALDMGLCVIDATHYAGEVLMVERLCGYLRKGFPNMDIYASGYDKRKEGLFEYNN